MKCISCGAEIPDSTETCSFCGITVERHGNVKVRSVRKSESQGDVRVRSVRKGTSISNRQPTYNQGRSVTTPASNVNNTLTLVVVLSITLGLVAIVLLVSFSGLSGGDNPYYTTTTSTTGSPTSIPTTIKTETTTTTTTTRTTTTTTTTTRTTTTATTTTTTTTIKPGNWISNFEWDYDWDTYSLEIIIPRATYDEYYYRERYPSSSDIGKYVTEDESGVIENIADELYNLAGEKDVYLLIAFVQSLSYCLDEVSTGYNELPKFPVETIVDECGDCEDTAILMAALFDEWGYTVIFWGVPGHMAIGVGCGSCTGYYVEHNEHKYYYLETTGEGWDIGQIPEEYEEATVRIYDIY